MQQPLTRLVFEGTASSRSFRTALALSSFRPFANHTEGSYQTFVPFERVRHALSAKKQAKGRRQGKRKMGRRRWAAEGGA